MAEDRDDARRQERPRQSRGPARGPRREEGRDRAFRGPRREGEDRGPRRERDDRPRRQWDERGPRRDGDERRPRRDGDDRGPRRDGEDRGPRRDGGERRPRRDWEDRGRRRDGDERRPRRDWEDRKPRVREPEIPEDIEAGALSKELRHELLTLSKDNAEGVARHLVAVGRALDAEEFDIALAHAEAAARRAGRVAGVREVLGVVHYRRQEWAKALAEFRTARRISGMDHLLPLMADVERGLGRPERALELAATPEAARLAPAEYIEMAIVVSGARLDLGQTAAAVQHLRDLALAGNPRSPWAARLRYAYAAALEADGQDELAHEWFEKAAALDTAGETDAAELLGQDEEPVFLDLTGDDVEPPSEPGDVAEEGGVDGPPARGEQAHGGQAEGEQPARREGERP